MMIKSLVGRLTLDFIFIFLVNLNVMSGILLVPYPLNLLFLAISSLKWEDPVPYNYFSSDELPNVTVQIPIYNESNIINETIKNLANMIYTPQKITIQFLDDSTDETSEIINKSTKTLFEKGYNIQIIKRSNREGFKAGALSNGIKKITSEYIAMFDADFQVDPNFLMDTIHYFKDNPNLGALQTRWDHRNLKYSIFTRAMSIGLDGHFLVEKPGRKRKNAFIGFNGTGGIWRKSVIEKSGGWSSQTLAEDLDLAYRAQILGYEIIYLAQKTNYQEIPPTLRSWIIQQSRWSKGFSQNIRKNFKNFIYNRTKKSKIQGILHLTQYLAPLLIVTNTVSGALLLFYPANFSLIFSCFGLIYSVLTICGIMSYIIAVLRAKRGLFQVFFIPCFLFWGAGLVIRMSIGSISGLISYGGTFVRTPKFNLKNENAQKLIIKEPIPIDWILFVEIFYICILGLASFHAFQLGVGFYVQAFYYLFITCSLLNMVISEFFHAFSNYLSS